MLSIRYYSCQAAVTFELANRLFHVLGKDHFVKKLCGFITAHSPLKTYQLKIFHQTISCVHIYMYVNRLFITYFLLKILHC